MPFSARFSKLLERLTIWVLAVWFTARAMRLAFTSDITWSDQARHALNGAALLDMFREGAMLRPVEFMRAYFAHFPAVSIPYHPPLFPAFEALFYSLFGVNPAAARSAVALTVFGSVWFLFLHVRSVYSSACVAAACVLVFFSMPMTQYLSADVMLEIPVMFCALGSLYFMRMTGEAWSRRDAVLSACFAAAAVWTKQAVFLGLIPLIALVLGRHWRLFRSPSLWIFTGTFGVSVLGLAALTHTAGFTGFSKGWAPVTLMERLERNGRFYWQEAQEQFGYVLIAALVLFAAAFLLHPVRRFLAGVPIRLHLAWILASCPVLVFVPAFDRRYLWLAYPPVIAILLAILHRVTTLVSKRLVADVSVLGIAVLFWLFHFQIQPFWVTGFASAANHVGTGRRILYCGGSSGSFIFALRGLDPGRRSYVIRADKVEPQLGESSVQAFSQKYGITSVVLERNGMSPACSELAKNGSLPGSPHSFPLISNIPDKNGSLEIYALAEAPGYERFLDVPVSSTGRTLRLNLDQGE